MAFDHREGSADNPYAPVMGKTFVEIGERVVHVLDDAQTRTLTSWVARLIPGDSTWPSAGELDTVDYIQSVLNKAPELTPVVTAALHALDDHAGATLDARFDELNHADQVNLLADLEGRLAPEAFSIILELTYEAYYRAPRVQEVARSRTGFDIANTVIGKAMDPFPMSALDEMMQRPDRYRSVPA